MPSTPEACSRMHRCSIRLTTYIIVQLHKTRGWQKTIATPVNQKFSIGNLQQDHSNLPTTKVGNAFTPASIERYPNPRYPRSTKRSKRCNTYIVYIIHRMFPSVTCVCSGSLHVQQRSYGHWRNGGWRERTTEYWT
jgi:hypothetical protein